MTISLQAAEQIGMLTATAFGLALVFVGLICIIAICSIVGALCRKFIQDDKKAAPSVAPEVTANSGIANKGEFVAAVSAALAEELGTDVTGIRIHSIKKLS